MTIFLIYGSALAKLSDFNNERLIMKHIKIIFSLVFIFWVFILNGCGGGSGGGAALSPSPIPSGAVPVITAFAINGSAGVITGNKIAITVPFGTNVTSLTATFTVSGSVVSVGGIPQVSGVTKNNFTAPVVYMVTRIGTSTNASLKASDISSSRSYTVTVTVASISAKAITAFSLGTPSSTSTSTSGIISILNMSVVMPFGTNLKSLVATFTTSGASVTVNGIVQVNGVTQNDFTNPVTYKVTAADGTTLNYIVTVTVSSALANDIISFSLDGTPGVISQGGLAQTIVVKVPFGTNVNGLVTTFITTGANVVVNGVTQISGTTQNDFTNPVTYIITSANGTVQTYTVTVIVSSSSSKFINDFSFGNISGVFTGQNIAVTVPSGTNVTGLVASFTTTGVNVTVGGIDQTSTLTPNDFTNPVTYTVTAADGTTATYDVIVTVASASSNSITAFSFGTVNGVITNQNIAVTMPFGTDVTNLVATFSTSGARVSVGTVTQVSGTTVNNFTNPVSYIVTAADGSTATYTVTVTVARSSAKAITAFSIAGIAGTFTDFNIKITLPFGSSTTNVATFTTTGAIVSVNEVIQFSGTTNNDFTSPVTYMVTAADGTTQNYIVTVTVAQNSAKAMTSFFLNGNLGTITNFAIAVSVPFGTNITALTATFTSTGASVNIDGVGQNSGGAPTNDFTTPVVYTVVAADGTTQNYTVTVTVLPSPDKAITAFTLPGNASSIITGQNIAVVMPTGTNLTTPLIATFTASAGASVSIGATPQTSGVTSNVFSSPIVYTVTAADTSTTTYTVTVTTVTYAYVNNFNSGTISMYSLNEANGQLTPLSPATIATGAGSYAIALDATKQHLYSANFTGSSISVYDINSSNGQLSLNSTVSNGGQRATGITFSPSGNYAYVSNFGNNSPPYLSSVGMYSVDGTGQLTALVPATIPITLSAAGVPIFITTIGSFIYVCNSNGIPSGTIEWYSVNNATGQLTSGGALQSTINSPAALASFSSSLAYTLDQSINRVVRLNVNSLDGSLSAGGFSLLTGSSPQLITISSSGSFLYVTNRNSNTVSRYSITAGSGALTSLGTTATGSLPMQLTFSPSGSYAYVTNNGGSSISMYNVTAGALSPLSPGPTTVAAGSGPNNIIFLY